MGIIYFFNGFLSNKECAQEDHECTKKGMPWKQGLWEKLTTSNLDDIITTVTNVTWVQASA